MIKDLRTFCQFGQNYGILKFLLHFKPAFNKHMPCQVRGKHCVLQTHISSLSFVRLKKQG